MLEELRKEYSSKRTSQALLKNRIKYHNEKDYSIPELQEMVNDLENQIQDLRERINEYNLIAI